MPETRLRPGREAVARAIQDAAEAGQDPEAPWLRGTVQSVATGPARVVVTVQGMGSFRCPYLASYTSPAANDVVWLARVTTGSYLCVGRQA